MRFRDPLHGRLVEVIVVHVREQDRVEGRKRVDRERRSREPMRPVH